MQIVTPAATRPPSTRPDTHRYYQAAYVLCQGPECEFMFCNAQSAPSGSTKYEVEQVAGLAPVRTSYFVLKQKSLPPQTRDERSLLPWYHPNSAARACR